MVLPRLSTVAAVRRSSKRADRSKTSSCRTSRMPKTRRQSLLESDLTMSSDDQKSYNSESDTNITEKDGNGGESSECMEMDQAGEKFTLLNKEETKSRNLTRTKPPVSSLRDDGSGDMSDTSNGMI